MPYSTYVRAASNLQALKDVNGLYRALLRLASPSLVAARMPRRGHRRAAGEGWLIATWE